MKEQVMTMVNAIISDRFLEISSGQASKKEILDLFQDFDQANNLLLVAGEQGFLDKSLKPEDQVKKLFADRIDKALATI